MTWWGSQNRGAGVAENVGFSLPKILIESDNGMLNGFFCAATPKVRIIWGLSSGL